MESQMEGHQNQPPKRGQDVQRLGPGPAPGNRQEGKHRLGQDHPAHHGPHHGQKQKQVDHQLAHPEGRVPPPEQPPVPRGVQGMVGHPEGKHPRPQPFVGGLPGDLPGHQQQKEEGHGQVDATLPYGFRFHPRSPPSR